ncbi:MAG: 4-hydroxyphenylacetate 3-hydroxylase family protein [Candidatus Bathyarchaeia archaeon]
MRTSEEYISDLEKMRDNVYMGGELVKRTDPRIRPGINVMSVTFDLAHDPDYEVLMTAKSHLTDEKINRFTHIPQNVDDLLKKQKMIRLYAQRVGGCIQRCMGLDAIVALSIATKEVDSKHKSEYYSRFINYLKYFQENDLCAACAQTDVKGDRSKRPHEQEDPDLYLRILEVRDDGIVVRGAKNCITMAPYADEIIVVPTRAMREEDKDYAVSFAIPADHENVYLINRSVWLRKRKKFRAPFAEVGVSDSFIVFDDTFVPKERVFMCGEWEFARRLALLFANSHRHSYTGCKPAVSDILAGATALVAEYNGIERAPHVRDKVSEIIGSAELSYAAGVASAVYGHKTSSGTFFPNPIYANVGRRLMGETIYHEYNILTEIAGGLMVTLPFEDEFITEKTKPFLDKYMKRNPKISPEDMHRCFRFIENLAASELATWYQIAGVHGGGSPIMETIVLMSEYDIESKKDIAKYLAGIKKELNQSKSLSEKPSF